MDMKFKELTTHELIWPQNIIITKKKSTGLSIHILMKKTVPTYLTCRFVL